MTDEWSRPLVAEPVCPVCSGKMPLVGALPIIFSGKPKECIFTFACDKCRIRCEKFEAIAKPRGAGPASHH